MSKSHDGGAGSIAAPDRSPGPTPGPGPTLGETTIYFDGGCPICSREVAHYRTRRGAGAMQWVDASACPDAALGAGLTRDAALGRMHVRTPDGRLVDGARAFATLWRGLPGFAWLGRISGHPLVAPVAEAGYQVFLRVRRVWR